MDETPPAMQDARRDETDQFALPLVIRVERATPPARTDALEGAAQAVLRFLSDPRVATADGEWAAAARAWEDARIRKVVRRARGAAWERAGVLPGITVAQRSAEIRVYPPVPGGAVGRGRPPPGDRGGTAFTRDPRVPAGAGG